MKESTIKIITVLMLVAILVVIYILNPSFYSDFWRVATSGNMQETMDYIASFGIWAMVFSFLLDVLINALGFLPSIFVSTANGFKIMLILRAMPYFPSGILTALGAVSRISLKDYALANLIGKFPSTALEVVIGHDVVNYKNNLDRLMIVIVLVCIIYGAIWYYNRRKERKTA